MSATRVSLIDEQGRRERAVSRAVGRCRVLLVAACEPHLVLQGLARVREHVPGCEITCLVSRRQEAVRERLQEADVACALLPTERSAMWTSMRGLRRERFDLVAVTWGGERGYRRLLLAALVVGLARLLVFDRSFDGGARAGQPVLRYWARRLARSRPPLLAGARATDTAVDHQASVVTFRQHAAPRVSVIVTVGDGSDAAFRCLTALLGNTTETAYEVILVTRSDSDEARHVVSRTKGARILRAPAGGLLRARNDAARMARGRSLAFLSDEAMVEAGWLEAALAMLDARPDCGAVGAKLISDSGRLREAGGIVWRDGSLSTFGRGDDPHRWVYDYAREVDYCSGAALLVSRDAWDRVGGFDERFASGSFEAVDLCFSLREAGRTVWFQPAASVVLTSATETPTSSGRQPAPESFRAKWRTRLAEQPPIVDETATSFSARDRNRGPLLMVFDHYVPMPDRDAGSYFMSELLDALVDLGCRVVFWPENLYRLPIYSERLQARGIEVVHGDVSLGEYVRSLGRVVDLAMAHRARIAARFLPEIKQHCIAQAYLAADLEHLRETRRCEVECESSAPAVVEGLRSREGEILRSVDLVTVHSPVERAMLERDFPGVRVVEMPLPSPRVKADGRSFHERRDILFVGSTHPPNVDAVAHFVESVLPLVREQLGDVKLMVVGEVCRDVKPFERLPGVELVGYAKDLHDWLGRARVFVSPLRYGAGIKGKILTALKAGLPVVTTPVGAEGIGLEDRRSALVADRDQDFARAVAQVYTDPALWASLRVGGLELVEQRHSSEIFRRTVKQVVESLLRERVADRPSQQGAG